MISRLVRLYLKTVILSSQVLFIGVEKVIALVLRPRYQIAGACKQRAACCQYLGIQVARPLWRNAVIIRLIVAYYEWMWGFAFLKSEEDYLMFRCSHIRKDGRCGVYAWRPGICRVYPRRGPYDRPVFLPGCGFYAIDRLTGERVLPLEEPLP